MPHFKTFTASNFRGTCECHDISCPHGTADVALPVRVIELSRYGAEIRSYSFCSVKCANDFYGETSEGTLYPFPADGSAPTQEQIAENQSYFRYDNQD